KKDQQRSQYCLGQSKASGRRCVSTESIPGSRTDLINQRKINISAGNNVQREKNDSNNAGNGTDCREEDAGSHASWNSYRTGKGLCVSLLLVLMLSLLRHSARA